MLAAAPASNEPSTWRNPAANHRFELQRQHALLVGVWRWYLGPILPGLLNRQAARRLEEQLHTLDA